MTLSGALAIYNEEKNIIACLATFYDFVDEIIIVDGESTDKTIELIKKFDTEKKIKIFEFPNPVMFHINKQRAIDRCTKDWILQMDGDEHISNELKYEIIKLIKDEGIKNIPDAPVGYWMPRLNYFLGHPLHKGGQYPDYTIRLYQNGKALLACKTVHEQAEVDGTVGYLEKNLIHYPFPDFAFYMMKWDRYSTQEALLLEKKGVKADFKNFVRYFLIKPTVWFFKTFFRNRGYVDGFPGFIFSLFSAVQNWAIYIKLWENQKGSTKK